MSEEKVLVFNRKVKKMKKKYVVMGGNPFRGYTGTTTFTALRTLGIFDTQEEADKCIDDKFDDCGGLIHVQEVTFD